MEPQVTFPWAGEAGPRAQASLRRRKRLPAAVQLDLELHCRTLRTRGQQLQLQQVGQVAWPRGAPEGLQLTVHVRLTCTLADLLGAWARVQDRWERSLAACHAQGYIPDHPEGH